MHDLRTTELAKLKCPVRYKNAYQDGHRFYVEDDGDIEIVKAIILAKVATEN
jgi:hypothetical protein